MRVKTILTCLTCLAVAALAGIVLTYSAALFSEFAAAAHEQGAVDHDMDSVFRELAAYRVQNGKWPATAEEAVGQGSLFIDPIDPISQRPFLYNPEAEPGTKDALIAQPVPIVAGKWPFKKVWQHGIAADGTFIDLAADGVGVDRLR